MENKSLYWKGFDELNKEESFEKERHKEFPQELPIEKIFKPGELNLSSSRRDFLKFFGFSVTAATLAACTKAPVKKAIPYLIQPEEITPGIANYYASTCHGCDAKCSVLVKTREGRPIKIEPNPESELFAYGTCALGQGTVLSLYDKGRLTGPMKGRRGISHENADAEITEKLRQETAEGRPAVILSNSINSPSTLAAIESFTRAYPGTRHIMLDAISSYGILQAHQEVFGDYAIPGYRFNQAKTILSIDADFLGSWISPVEFTRQYSDARRVDEKKDMAYHLQFETTLSITGANADFRAPIKPSQLGAVVMSLHNHIAGGGVPDPGLELAGNAIRHAADRLKATAGNSLVVCGSNDVEIQKMIIAINQALGNYGKTLNMSEASLQKRGNDVEFNRLITEMETGNTGAIIFYHVNPVYDSPQGERFAKALSSVPLTVSFNERLDETTLLAHYAIPDHNYLESWNDSQPKRNYFSLTQPTITPIFDTRAAQQSLLTWAGAETTDYYQFIRDYWQSNVFTRQTGNGNFNNFWNQSVHDGTFKAHAGETTGAAGGNVNLDQQVLEALQHRFEKGQHQLELKLFETVAIREGKHANNPWMQELPDPISKVTWDNYIAVSPRYAQEQNIKDEDVLVLKGEGFEIELPALVQPGQAYNTFSIAVGYGHQMDSNAGKIANVVGKNAFPLSLVINGIPDYTNIITEVIKTGKRHKLAQTQTHHHIEGRDTIREAPLSQYIANPASVHTPEVHLVSLYPDWEYPGHHWGMAIDMNACTGCGSCVVSCQAENNIPVVGKAEVLNRRELHWIRVDRYYSIPTDDGDETRQKNIKLIDDPDKFDKVKVTYQPMTCQHCDNAPCENVCPVTAIAHSSEGLNQQVYNRCVGTRYCANNCPYKVRRFNWFSYYDNNRFDDINTPMNTDLGRMVLNPDVVVRARGTMEKCSFCVQRIQLSRLEAKKENRPLADGEIKTACQTACPANAIVFGDMNDPESEVSKLMRRERTYGVLTEIQTKPSVRYLQKIRVDHNQA